MLIARFFDGVAGSVFLSVAGGTVGDLFAGKELSLPMMIFTASPMFGLVSPSHGGGRRAGESMAFPVAWLPITGIRVARLTI